MDISGTMTKAQLLLEYSRKKQQLSEVEEAIRKEKAKNAEINQSKSVVQSYRQKIEEYFKRQKTNVNNKIRSVQEQALVLEIYKANTEDLYFSRTAHSVELLKRAERALESADRSSDDRYRSLDAKRFVLLCEIEQLKKKIANA